MMFALIALVATLQAKSPDVQLISAPAPVSQPAPAPAPVVVEEAPLPTRQVCR